MTETAKLLALLSLLSASRADSWRPPTPEVFYSEDGSKQVRFIPEEKQAELIVSAVSPDSTNQLWSVKTTNVPVSIYLSNSGSNIVTTDSLRAVGYGDFVVAIYSPEGLLKNFSLETFAPPSLLSNRHNQGSNLYRNDFPHSTSSRWWATDSFHFFLPNDKPTNFCIWLPWRESWTTFNLNSGNLASLAPEALDALNSQARAQAYADLADTNSPPAIVYPGIHSDLVRALKFLTWLRRPEDLPRIQAAMRSRTFQLEKSFRHFTLKSGLRSAADLMLAKWNGVKPTDTARNGPINLGTIEGTIRFAKPVGNIGSLHLYLVPVVSNFAALELNTLEHSFSEFFDPPDYRRFYGTEIKFTLESIAPGDYHIKVIHDVARPFAIPDGSINKPSPGDFVSVDGPPITVTAGKLTSDITIDCRTKFVSPK